VGNGLGLDRRGDLIALFADGAKDLLGQIQFYKTHDNFLNNLAGAHE
jgi:hypothetical protein